MLKAKIVIISLLVLACSCDSESDISNIFISIPIDYYDLDVNGGDKIFYPIEIASNKDVLSSVEITTTDNVDGTVTIYLDDNLDARTHSFEYGFTAPTYSKYPEVDVVLRIKAIDKSGYSGQIALAITITSTVESEDVELVDISSISLYGGASGKENGYSFVQSKFINSSTAEPYLVDFYDYSEDGTNETISSEWRTMSGRYFARLTGYDYSRATLNTVLSGYDLAAKLDVMRDIKEDDIIFIGYDEQTPLAVIKVNAIIDSEGTENDRYIISMKRTYLEETIEDWGKEEEESKEEEEDNESSDNTQTDDSESD